MKYFSIFSNCIITNGLKRSIICDTLSKQIYIIPNDIKNIIDELKTKKLERLLGDLDTSSQLVLGKYIEYFIDEGIGFMCDDPSLFPDINLDYFSPEIINNCIIELNENSRYDILNVINQLTSLRCKFLEIRCFDDIPLHILNSALEESSKGFYRNVDILYKYPTDPDKINSLKNMINSFPIVGTLLLHSSNENKRIDSYTIKSTAQVISSSQCCGQINQDFFSIDLRTIAESQKFNTCLNQKIAIDKDGNIKNCPSMIESYGNLEALSLLNVLNMKKFTDKWKILKDDIEICKNCEFRYICTDCRAYLENPNNLYSKPLKCGYDPETNLWNDWATNPLKNTAIKYYDFDMNVINPN